MIVLHGIAWPSLQQDSEILRQRIAPQLRVLYLRSVLHSYLEMTRAAA